jgi:hypothetical protein
MESTAFYFISACFMVLFGLVGIIVGWHTNDVVYNLIAKKNSPELHPEMIDDDGFIINEELLSVRFIDEEEEDDYY